MFKIILGLCILFACPSGQPVEAPSVNNSDEDIAIILDKSIHSLDRIIAITEKMLEETETIIYNQQAILLAVSEKS